MDRRWHRRMVVATVATASVAGCLGAGDPDDDRTTTDGTSPSPTTDTATPLPSNCPTTQGLDVAWPDDLDADAAESFVEAYDAAYYREVVVDYEPESPLDEYGLDGSVVEGPTERGDGYVVRYSGSGGVYRPNLHVEATVSAAPEGADVADAADIDDQRVSDLLDTAAAEGSAQMVVERPEVEDIDRYLELFASLSSDFEPLDGPGEEDTLYVDVDGISIEVSVMADRFHGDIWWDAFYYVDDTVVRRTEDEGGDPRGGTLLECRQSA